MWNEHESTSGSSSSFTSIGRYRISKRLGEGGFAEVFLAEDSELERQVAIKVARSGAFSSHTGRKIFLGEAQKVAGLRHPYLVTIYDTGILDDDRVFVVMEFVSGGTLRELVGDPWIPFEAVDLMAKVADAVHCAHLNNIFHRDLKPENILLDQEGQPRVADFGLAVRADEQRDHAGELSGTTAYMSPEQVRGEVHLLDGRSDIWALGIILYEMLVGSRPFHGATKQVLVDEILHREARPPRQVRDHIPESLERVCLKCLAKKVNERYTTAADLARELQASMKEHFNTLPATLDTPAANSKPDIVTQFMLGPFGCAAVVTLAGMLAAVMVFYLKGAYPSVANLNELNQARAEVVQAIPSDSRMSVKLHVRIWDPQSPSRQGITLHDPGALPVRNGDQIRIEAQISQPSYVYVVWIDSEGRVSPIYPWQPGDWNGLGKVKSVTDIQLPKTADHGAPISGPDGMESVVLLARSTPLPADLRLNELIGNLPPQMIVNAKQLLEFEQGRTVSEHGAKQRAAEFGDTQQINDPVLRTQAQIQERLGQYFLLIRAVSFAHRGE